MHLTYLFVPADSPRKIEKALTSEAGALILDLEDGVAAADKPQAREHLRSWFREHPVHTLPKRILLRCNARSTTDFAIDIDLVKECGIRTLMLPKCESAWDIQTITRQLPDLRIVPLLETAAGVHHLPQIAAASPHIRRVAFGSVDYALDLGVDWTPEGTERLHAMGQIVLQSRAVGLEPPIDAVFPVLDDQEAFYNDIRLGRKMGFHGKMIIHPRQIAPIHEIYQPTPEQQAWYERVVSAYEAAGSKGSLQLDGKLVDLPVYKRAKRAIAK